MSEEFEKYVISKIEEIHAQKVGKVEPDYVMFIELSKSIIQDLKDTLNKFYKEKKYKIEKTLNDRYIKNEDWDG